LNAFPYGTSLVLTEVPARFPRFPNSLFSRELLKRLYLLFWIDLPRADGMGMEYFVTGTTTVTVTLRRIESHFGPLACICLCYLFIMGKVYFSFDKVG
jgi:hypothetical protein